MANECRSETGGAMTASGVRAALSDISASHFRGMLAVLDGGESWTLGYGSPTRGEPPFRIALEEGGEISWRHVPDRDRWWLGTCVACKVIRSVKEDGGYADEADGERVPADFDLRHPTLSSWQATLGGGRILKGLARLAGGSLGKAAEGIRMDGPGSA